MILISPCREIILTFFNRQIKLLDIKRSYSYGEEDQVNTDCFPTLHGILQENSMEILEPSIKIIFTQHLSSLSTHFDEYFPENLEQYDWVRSPFQSTSPSTLSTVEERLIELSCDSMKIKMNCLNFESRFLANILGFNSNYSSFQGGHGAYVKYSEEVLLGYSGVYFK
nr:unnamed protein product [Callosobruchus analis]